MSTRMIVFALAVAVARPALSVEYFVSSAGDDASAGTQAKPFRTIQKAADAVAAGDTCFVREGTYRETIKPKTGGGEGKPVRFVAYPGEVVTLSGTEPVAGKWQVHNESIYKSQVDREFEQLFVDGEMMIEARWPNAAFNELLDRSKWAHARRGSKYGVLADPELGKTGVDWTGALATLNVTHQFYTWTRPVTKHAAGETSFEYPKDFGPQTEMRYGEKTAPWEDDRYYLAGKLEALDAPTEWFLDRDARTLYLWTKDGSNPADHTLEAKARDYAFEAEGVDYVQLEGFRFFGATFSFRNCNHCVVDGCHLLFPTFTRELTELNPPETRRNTPRTEMMGDHNVLRNSSLAYSPTSGVTMAGKQTLVENCLLHDVCWTGSLRNVALAMSPGAKSDVEPGGVVRGNTLFNCGNAIINYRSQPYQIEYNHCYDGGLACKDVALIYTGQPSCAGSVVHHNWAHGCWTEIGGGLGIRGDDQTRSLTVHHNVVWDCGRDGIIVKGDNNRVHNNTCLFLGTKARLGNYIAMPTRKEPTKPWRKQHTLLEVQNENSLIYNNAARTINGNQSTRTPFPFEKCLANNHAASEEELKLMNVAAWDFRPAAGSPLIDAGREIEGFTDGFVGKAPDIGAYEAGGENWKPGHRNGVWVSPPARAAGVGVKTIRVALLMPVRDDVSLNVLPSDPRVQLRAGTRLTFGPPDWMVPQEVTYADRNPGPFTLRLAVPAWGDVEIAVGSRSAHGTRAWFPQPDIGKPTPLDTRFRGWRSVEQKRKEQVLTALAERLKSGQAENLLTNGDFETADTSSWSRTSNQRPTPEAMQIDRVREGADGGWCVKLHCDDADLMKEGVLKWLHPLPKDLKPGMYVLSYDVRLANLKPGAGGGMFCSYLRTEGGPGRGSNAGQMEYALADRNLDWAHQDCVIEIPPGARLSFVSLQLHKATGTAWVDNVALYRGE